MFFAPVIVTNILDFRELYNINESQGEDLSLSVRTVSGNTCISKSNDYILSIWEDIMGITNQSGASLDERRSIILSKLIKNSFSLDVLRSKLDALCGGRYELSMDSSFTTLTVRIASVSLFLLNAIIDMLESLIPLNVMLDIQVIYNSYGKLSLYKHSELSSYTHQELREESDL